MQTICIRCLVKEMHYDCIVLNMGTRFKGFFDILDRCSDIYLVQKKGGISQWREYEFTEELIERGLSNVVERIKLIEPPVITTPASFAIATIFFAHPSMDSKEMK